MSNSRMVDAVNRLIGNKLAASGTLFLPDVGTLRTERRPARRVSKRRILPPCRTVCFTSREEGPSLVDEIAAAAGVEAEKAAEIYRTWLGRVRQGEELSIEGVGTLVQKSFRLDPTFDRLLNPAGREPVAVGRGCRFDFVLWLGVAAIVFSVGFGGYWWWNAMSPLHWHDVATALGADSVAADRTVAATGRSVDSVGKGATAGDVDVSDRGTAASAADAAIPAEESAASGRGAEVDATGAADTLARGSSATERSVNEGAGGDVSAPAEPSGTRVLPLVSGRRYAVLGVYSTVDNALRAVRDAAAQEPAFRCTVYRFGAKYMVSPFESDDAQICAQFIRAHAQTAPGMWTYTAR